ncbi:ABC transporter permease [Dehalogenimonas alkenigignens]|uniref:Transport permease protein n=1 Tax=Dehalogenimonas alkenigignens TaxID=1217799 RepID=A0A0W0GGE1_9CHLR|nr:ABC transporter permease [Dehalogenimonas alkenigignens]KTB47622.1 ABC-type polysaccharide/polyol phosphate export system, permease component [Dehalogenimonas alkenigignens]PVV82839.1 ABC transporter [Dehalogenimonas alkenigignens]
MAGLFRAVWVTAYRELIRFYSDGARVFSSFAMPVLFLFVLGSGFSRTIGALMPGVDFLQFMYPGIVALIAFQTSLQSGLSIVWDREFGFLKEVLVAPLPRHGIVFGKALGTAVIALFQGMILLILAPIVGVELSLGAVAQLMPVLILISLSISGLGLLIASGMRSMSGFQMATQLVVFPTMFASGAFFPLNNVPGWLAALAKINPLTYGVDAVRHLLLGSEAAAAFGVRLFGRSLSFSQDLVIIAGIGLVFISLAALSFGRRD